MESGLRMAEILNRSLGIILIFTVWTYLVSIILILDSGEKSLFSFVLSVAFVTNLYPAVIMLMCYFVCVKFTELKRILLAVSITSICYIIIMNFSVILILTWVTDYNDIEYNAELSYVFSIPRLMTALFSGLAIGFAHWAFNLPSVGDEPSGDEIDLPKSRIEDKIEALEMEVKEVAEVLKGLMLKMKARVEQENQKRDWEHKRNLQKSIDVLDKQM